MKTYVITLSRLFPKGHRKEGASGLFEIDDEIKRVDSIIEEYNNLKLGF